MKNNNFPHHITQLLEQLTAPTRLLKHLQIVHATAYQLLILIEEKWPSISLQKELVLFGAATHDIGKIEVPLELFEPGKKHEQVGQKMLTELGFTNEQARFAYTHGNWSQDGVVIEDLLVGLSDKIWKGKRIDELEEKVVQAIASSIQEDFWTVYTTLDKILSQIAMEADRRIHWQNV